MPRSEINLNPVDHITVDALGPPGQRVFYLQAQKGTQTVTLIAEKFQVQSLAIGVERFLAEISDQFPDLPLGSSEYDEIIMRIQPPVDPLFRLANIGLGYSAEDDLVVLVVHELMPDDSLEEQGAEGEEGETFINEDASVVRFWCTRSQLMAMAHWGAEVSSRGRPLCPQCGDPMEPEGHFCVKKNGGHKRN